MPPQPSTKKRTATPEADDTEVVVVSEEASDEDELGAAGSASETGDERDVDESDEDEAEATSTTEKPDGDPSKKPPPTEVAIGTAGGTLCQDPPARSLDCSRLDPRTCPIGQILCQTVEDLFESDVGQGIIDCLAERGCREPPRGCVERAVMKACVDASAKKFCADRFAACRSEFESSGITLEVCQHGLSALKPEPRARLEECARDSCDIERCLGERLPER